MVILLPDGSELPVTASITESSDTNGTHKVACIINNVRSCPLSEAWWGRCWGPLHVHPQNGLIQRLMFFSSLSPGLLYVSSFRVTRRKVLTVVVEQGW